MQDETNWIAQHWRSAMEIGILWMLLYHTYRYFKATRGARIFTSLVVTFLGIFIVSVLLRLEVIVSLLSRSTLFFAIGLVIIFQPELRRAFAEIGSSKLFLLFYGKKRVRFADDLVEILETMGKRRIGALIAIQRNIDLVQYLESGTRMDSLLTPELVHTIFFSGTTLHDGGMIIRVSDERISGAGCVFPLTQKELSDQSIGLRHRAAIGITEESDAIALVVSEETGAISLAIEGQLEQHFEKETLRERLDALLGNQDVKESPGINRDDQ